MSSAERANIPLLGRLIPDGIRPGTVLVAEFEPDSQWLAIATTITARSLDSHRHALYAVFTRPPELIKQDLSRLGVDVAVAQSSKRLIIDDWYSATLTGGRLGGVEALESTEDGARIRSLKVADLSVQWSKGPRVPAWDTNKTWPSGWLLLADSFSVLARFNEEKPILEWLETREIPATRNTGRIDLQGFVRGIHSDSFYRRLEAASDGIIDVRVMDSEGKARNFLRVRSLKGQPHETSWHEVEIKSNGEAVMRN